MDAHTIGGIALIVLGAVAIMIGLLMVKKVEPEEKHAIGISILPPYEIYPNYMNGEQLGPHIINGMDLLIHEPLTVDISKGDRITDCKITLADDFKGEAIFIVKGDGEVPILRNTIYPDANNVAWFWFISDKAKTAAP